MITQSELKILFNYDLDTGVFTRLVTVKNSKAGTVINKKDTKGYIYFSINKKMYLGHRLAWFYVNGVMPVAQIDHINGLKDDNRFINLRECNNSQNNTNIGIRADNTSGFKNVSFSKRSNNWVVFIRINGKKAYLGGFEDIEFADLIATEARNKYHGEFARHS